MKFLVTSIEQVKPKKWLTEEKFEIPYSGIELPGIKSIEPQYIISFAGSGNGEKFMELINSGKRDLLMEKLMEVLKEIDLEE